MSIELKMNFRGLAQVSIMRWLLASISLVPVSYAQNGSQAGSATNGSITDHPQGSVGNGPLPVGSLNSVTFFYNCRDEYGNLICQEPVEPEGLEITPDTELAIFSNSQYVLDSGYIDEQAPPISNLYDFVLFSGATWEPFSTNVFGYGCREQCQNRPSSYTFEYPVTGPTITNVAPRCPHLPKYINRALEWSSATLPNGCVFQCNVRNDLSRSATYGVMNLITAAEFYLIINGTKVPYVQTQGVVLDDFAEDANTKHIVNPGTAKTIPAGGSDTLLFTDSPSLTPGEYGCWKSPTKSGNYTSIGYDLSFQTFLVQDWDATPAAKVRQLPIGPIGDITPVYAWRLQAQAEKATRGWTVNTGVSKLTGPSEDFTMDQGRFVPTYQGHITSGNYDKGRYDGTYYELDEDPAV